MFPAASIVVLGTKRNLVKTDKMVKNKVAAIHKELAKVGIPANKFMEFSTPCEEDELFEKDINNAQYEELQNLLN